MDRVANSNVIGGRVQQADAADGARRFGVARFARQSSLMRAPQLIRGVRRTEEAGSVPGLADEGSRA
jgi:hypothetical protein